MKQFVGEFSAALRSHGGPGSWYFLDLPKIICHDLEVMTRPNKKAFRTIKVFCEAQNRLKTTKVTWETSVFYDKKLDIYLLPVKKQVRTRLSIDDGDEVNTIISLV